MGSEIEKWGEGEGEKYGGRGELRGRKERGERRVGGLGMKGWGRGGGVGGAKGKRVYFKISVIWVQGRRG